jgi:predicted nucleic-acid-binding protein
VIGLDTNVLVRYLTQDDAAQGHRANVLVADAATKGDRCFIASVVLCELVWVLRGAYGFDKATVVSALERILATTQFEIDEKDIVRRALEDYRGGKGDFADYVIGHRGLEAGCAATASFDRRLKGSVVFRVLAA